MEKPKNPKQYVGKKVRMIDKDLHKSNPGWYPKAGTIGSIVDFDFTDNVVFVDWGENSGVGKNFFMKNNYTWAVNWKFIKLVNDTQPNQPSMTDEEIWEMLESKMRKNNLKRFNSYEVSLLKMYGYDYNYYTANDVHNAIALAYRSGYERAMKGRPFKIDEKKKKGGHWEPIDPSNLPKEGTRVRYMRIIDNDNSIPFNKWSGMKVGDETTVTYAGTLFGVKDIYDKYPHSQYVCCNDCPERFDMWVEDDE